MSVIAVIPARCGSKGFPHKNVARIGGKTLLDLAINVAKNCRYVDDVYVSTDSPIYAEIAISAGASLEGLRPHWLAGDNVKSVDVVIDLLGRIEKRYERLILLQPTSPVRTPVDVDAALATLVQRPVDAVVSVELLEEPHPEKVKRIDLNGILKSYISGASSEMPRQQLPPAYRLNGAIYAINTSALLEQNTFLPEKTAPYHMCRGINIDSEDDFIVLRTLFEMGRINIYGAKNNAFDAP